MTLNITYCRLTYKLYLHFIFTQLAQDWPVSSEKVVAASQSVHSYLNYAQGFGFLQFAEDSS